MAPAVGPLRPGTQAAPRGGGEEGEVCYAWNNGNCREPCPNHRRHVCVQCGGSHPRTRCTKGRKGGKGKGGKGGRAPD